MSVWEAGSNAVARFVGFNAKHASENRSTGLLCVVGWSGMVDGRVDRSVDAVTSTSSIDCCDNHYAVSEKAKIAEPEPFKRFQ